MLPVVWLEGADADLAAITAYISERNPQAADRLWSRIRASVVGLSQFPYMGVIPRYKSLRIQGLRILVIESHLAFYRINESEKEVVIIRILHGSQDYVNMI